ncbi:MAG: response regulator transcription factor [Oscillospiraceae bacterium]|nr:response regulator transcription factor [Oscillospiraceae bacterium]
MSRILIVEDDADISNMLRELLSPHYSISQAFSGTEAVMCAEREEFDLILLDLMLPGLTGEEVLERIRSQGNVPVIAVSAKDDKSTKVGLLKSGVDDFIGKPFDNDELMARIEALLRRSSSGGSADVLTFKNVKLNRSTMEVSVRDKPVSLTKREYLILELLMSNPKKIFTKNNIFESVWNEQFLGEDNAVNVHISNIRQKLSKLDPDESYIQTVWGLGFKMSAD